jgi:proline iminopeptidase
LLGYSFGGELALEITFALQDKINKIVLSSLIGLKAQYFIQIGGFMLIADSSLVFKIEHIISFFENQKVAKKY